MHVTYLGSNIFWKLSQPPFAFFSSILLFKFCPHPLCWPPSCTWQGYQAQKVVIQGTSCPWIWQSISRVEMKAISHLSRTPNIHAKPSKLLHRSSVPSNQGLPNLIIKYMEWCCLYLKNRFLFGTNSGMGVKYFIANSQPFPRSYFIQLLFQLFILVSLVHGLQVPQILWTSYTVHLIKGVCSTCEQSKAGNGDETLANSNWRVLEERDRRKLSCIENPSRLLGEWVVKIKKINREKERRRVIEENSNKLGWSLSMVKQLIYI